MTVDNEMERVQTSSHSSPSAGT